MNDFIISNSQILLGAFLTMISGVVTLIVTEIFTSKRQRKERAFFYMKESVSAQQESARLIFNSLDAYKYKVGNMQSCMKNGLYDMNEFNPKNNIELYKQHQLNLFNETLIWFPSLEEDYNIIAKKFISITGNFLSYVRPSYSEPIEFEGMRCIPMEITDVEKEAFNVSVNDFVVQLNSFANKIKETLSKRRAVLELKK
jgi:hypothetical protein